MKSFSQFQGWTRSQSGFQLSGGLAEKVQHQSVVVKRELSQKAKLLIYWSIYVPTIFYVQLLWVGTERKRLQIREAEMSVLHKVS